MEFGADLQRILIQLKERPVVQSDSHLVMLVSLQRVVEEAFRTAISGIGSFSSPYAQETELALERCMQSLLEQTTIAVNQHTEIPQSSK